VPPPADVIVEKVETEPGFPRLPADGVGPFVAPPAPTVIGKPVAETGKATAGDAPNGLAV
jgi:hypothetical protein